MANTRRERKKVKSVLFSISLCACAIIASVVYGLKDMVEDLGEMTYTSFRGTDMERITLRATVHSVDLVAETLTVNWDVVRYSMGSWGGDSSNSFNIRFLGDNLIQSDGSTNEKSVWPVFQFSPTLWDTAHTNRASFQTRINLFPTSSSTSLRRYPFDTYTSDIQLVAVNSATNVPVGLGVIGVVGIPGFSAKMAFRIAGRYSIGETITISRGNATKAYATIFVLSVWVVTLIFLYSTSMSVICGYPQRVDFLGIPLATFFTVAQVRPTMPGSPDFGVLMDNVGLIPCLSLMAACSALTLGMLFMSDATEERASLGETFDWVPSGLYDIRVVQSSTYWMLIRLLIGLLI